MTIYAYAPWNITMYLISLDVLDINYTDFKINHLYIFEIGIYKQSLQENLKNSCFMRSLVKQYLILRNQTDRKHLHL